MDLPRLSVDIDLNYIGGPDRETMLAERPNIDKAVLAVCQREGFVVRRSPTEHAGGKWILRYDSVFGHGGNLSIDVNFMFRVPLWPAILSKKCPVGPYTAEQIPILDVHEIAAGKLCALLSRQTARDIFDTHQLLTRRMFQRERLRLAFVVYGAMNRKDWRTLSKEDIRYTGHDLVQELLPYLRSAATAHMHDSGGWAARLIKECRDQLSILLPFSDSEREFLDHILDAGEIIPSLLTADEEMSHRILSHPGLQWKALNAREFKGKP